MPLASMLPVAENDALYFSNAAVNMYTGQLIWNANVTANDNEYPWLFQDLVVVCGASQTTILNECCGLVQSDGSVAWRTQIASAGPVLYALSGNSLILQTFYNTSDPTQVQLLSISPLNGAVQWNRTIELGWFLGSTNNLLFVNFYDSESSLAGLSAVDASNGQTVWRRPLDGNWTVTDGRPDVFLSGDLIVVNFKNSGLYSALNMTTGQVVWITSLADGSCPGWPGMIGASAGTVLCVGQLSSAMLNITTGALLWQFGESQLCSGGSVTNVGDKLLFT